MHMIETRAGKASIFTVRDPAWHQLGTTYKTPPRTSREAMVAAGADWTVNKLPIGLLGDPAAIESHCAIVRDVDMRVLGVVGAGYTPVQNADAFGFFDHVVGEGRAEFESGGVLHEGKRVWALAKLAEGFEVVPGDAVQGYLLLTNAHDGSGAVHARFTPIRVVCANTLGAAMARGRDVAADRPISIRHTSGVKGRLEEAQRVLGACAQQIQDTSEAYRLIAKVQLGLKASREFFESVVGGERDAAGKLHARSANVVKAMEDLFAGAGLGSSLPGVSGTAWGAYNAVTEFVDFKRGVGKPNDSRLDSLGFGSGQDMKQKALRQALALVA